MALTPQHSPHMCCWRRYINTRAHKQGSFVFLWIVCVRLLLLCNADLHWHIYDNYIATKMSGFKIDTILVAA